MERSGACGKMFLQSACYRGLVAALLAFCSQALWTKEGIYVQASRTGCTCTRRYLRGCCTKAAAAALRLKSGSTPSNLPQVPLPNEVDSGATRSQSPPASSIQGGLLSSSRAGLNCSTSHVIANDAHHS